MFDHVIHFRKIETFISRIMGWNNVTFPYSFFSSCKRQWYPTRYLPGFEKDSYSVLEVVKTNVDERDYKTFYFLLNELYNIFTHKHVFYSFDTYSLNIRAKLQLTHSFPMHPFSTPGKYQKT